VKRGMLIVSDPLDALAQAGTHGFWKYFRLPNSRTQFTVSVNTAGANVEYAASIVTVPLVAPVV
jgi:hypothetical protein